MGSRRGRGIPDSPEPMNIIRTVVIASTLAMRAGMRALLESDPDIEVIAEASALGVADSPPPETEMLVVAGGLPARAQIEEVLESLESPPALVVMTDESEAVRFVPRLPLRAWGFIPLNASAEELVAAVKATYQGLIASPPELLEAVLSDPLQGGDSRDEALEDLTERELEVLGLLARGLANKQIASELGISEHTVKFHVSSIYGKLGATNRAEAVRLGARSGLIAL